MDADRIDVFHVADDDGIVVGIAHDLIFDFLEAGDAALDQTLMHRRDLQAVIRDQPQFLFIIRKAAAGAAQCIRRTDDVPDSRSHAAKFTASSTRMDDVAFRHRLIDLSTSAPGTARGPPPC